MADSRGGPASPWQVYALIGEGRTSTVHAARERVTGRKVALKIARTDAHEGALLAEYAVAGALGFAELVSPDAIGRLSDGRLAVAMEHIDGPPLAEADLAPGERLDVALGLCRAVAVLHGRGGYHGDLSPENVLVERRGGQARARLIDATPDRRVRVGTPGYIAPEVLRGGGPGPAADRYALGCLLHLVLTGEPVFDVDADRLVHHHLEVEPELDDDLSPQVAEAVGALLVKHPDDRASEVAGIIEALSEAAGRTPAAELVRVARAIIGGDRVIGRADIRKAMADDLASLADGWGSMRWIAGPRGSGRTALGRWLVAEAARAGRIATRITGWGDPISAAFAALGVEPPDRDVDSALTRAWIAAAEHAPRCVVLDMTDADPVVLRRVGMALGSASRTSPLALVVMAPTGVECPGIETTHLGPSSSPERRGIVFDRLGDDGPRIKAIADAVDVPALSWPGSLLGALTIAIDRRLIVWSGRGWVIDEGRLAAERAQLIDAAADTDLEETALAAIASPARNALAVFALAGKPLDEETLLAWGGPSVLSGLVVLENAELIHAVDQGLAPRRWSLARAALAGLDAEQLAAIHRAAAVAIEGDDELSRARRDRHRLLSGAVLDADRRVDVARVLVEHGASRDALEILEGDDGDALDLKITLATARAHVRVAQGQPDEALAELNAMPSGSTRIEHTRVRILARLGRHADVVASVDPQAPSASSRMWLARSLAWTGALDRADTVAASVLADADADADARGGARHVRATVRWQTGRLDEATEIALAALDDVEPGPVRADLLRTLGGVHIYRGDLESAAAPLEEAVELNRTLGRTPELAKSLNNLGILRFQRGDLTGARAAFEAYALLAGRIGDPVELANVENNLGQLALTLGEPARAATLCARALRVAEAAGYGRIVPVAHSNLGAALTRLGRLDEAAELLEKAGAAFTTLEANHDLMELRRRQMELYIARGERAKAMAIGEAVLDDDRLDAVPVEAGQVRRLMADLAIAAGEMETARGLAEDAIERLEALDCQHELAVARETRARVMYATGRFETAIMEVRRALQTHRALGARADADRAGHLLDEAEERYRRSDQSVRHAQILLELSLAMGSTLEVERLLPLALDGIIETLEVERGLIALYDGDEITEVVARHLVWDDPDSPLPVSESIVHEARKTGRAVVIQDAIEEGVVWTRTSVALLGLRSIVCLPIRTATETLGVMYVDSRRLVATDLDAEVELLTGVARLLGVALTNARAYASRVAAHATLTALLREARVALAETPSAGDIARRIDAALTDESPGR